MKPLVCRFSIVAIAFLATQPLRAQNQTPNIGYAYPAGGVAGSTFEVVVGGMNLQGVKGCRISGDGIVVESARITNPLGRISSDLRQELRPIIEALANGDDPIASSRKSTERMLDRLKKQAEKAGDDEKENGGKPDDSARKGAKGKAAGALDYQEMLKIVPGERLLYLDKTPEEVVAIIKALTPVEYQCLCKEILTRPNALQTSPAIDQKAIVKMTIQADAKPGARELRLYSDRGMSNPLTFMVGTAPETAEDYFTPKEKETSGRIESFPRVLNGEIMPGEVDTWKFHAKAGDTYRFSAKARSLVPYLGDAVPGWLQAVLSIHDHHGTTLAYCDDNRFDTDPVLGFTAPAAGDYEVRIRDAIYRGREDFVYRLNADMARVTPAVEIKGPSLPYEIRTLPENEVNNSPKQAQDISIPVLIQGTIGARNDVDCFSVALDKGQKLAVEVFARRQGSPMDSLVHILDSHSNVLQWNDDTNAVNVGLTTHHADSRCIFEAPATGKYCIKVSDAQAKGGSDYGYFLRADAPRPDFRVFMTPSALNKQRGAVPFKLKISRTEGFNGAVDVIVKDGPAGMRVDGARIPPETDEILMTLSLPRGTKDGPCRIQLAAIANVAGQTVEREVLPTDEVMQAFIYKHLLPASENILFVTKNAGACPIQGLTNEIVIKPGETLPMSLNCPDVRNGHEDVTLELVSAPPGLSVTSGKLEGGRYVFSIQADAEATSWSGNLVFQIFEENVGPKGVRRPAGCVPAIPARIY